MNARTIALLVGIGFFLGTLPYMSRTSQIRAEMASSEEQVDRKEMENQISQKTMEREDTRELERKPAARKSRKMGKKMDEERRSETGTHRDMPVERRPGGCPEGPPCKDRP